MPELPEVETIRRGLGEFILNKKIVRVEVREGKSFIGEKGQVEGAKVVGLGRRGKALLIELSSGVTLMIHLRMTGQIIWRGSFSERTTASNLPVRGSSTLSTAPLRASDSPCISSQITSPLGDASSHNLATSASLEASSEITSLHAPLCASDSPGISSQITSPREDVDVRGYADGATLDAAELVGQFAAGHPSRNFLEKLPNKQTRVIFEFEDGKMFFNDQRKFGFIKVIPTEKVEEEKFIRELGKEPWEMEAGELWRSLQRHGKAPVKAVLLDQKVIAGLGNIYADESLFYAKIHPTEPAGNLTEADAARILEGARKIMETSIESGGSTMATYLKPDGTTGDYLEKFAKVYGRVNKKCVQCGTEIEKIRCAGRGTHFCPKCQKLKGENEKEGRGAEKDD